MCYSLQSSIVAFAVAIMTGLALMTKNTLFDRSAYPLVLTYAFVQIGEAMMWYDTQCGPINKTGGYIVYMSLVLHVLAVGVGLYLVDGSSWGIIVGLIFAVYNLVTMPHIQCSREKSGHMNWGFDSTFYTFGYFLIFLIVCTIPISVAHRVVTMFWYTFLVMYLFFKKHSFLNILKVIVNPRNVNKSVASLWCYFASVLSPLLLVPYVILS